MRTRLIEGDDYHSAANHTKMRQGIPLTDADREGWLTTLAELLQQRPHHTVLACSALRKTYRDKLRLAATDLRFVYLKIDPEEARRRVDERAEGHFFPAGLVGSQFSTLESPEDEPGVLTLDARFPLRQLTERAITWLTKEAAPCFMPSDKPPAES